MFFTFTLLSGLLASQAAAQLTKPVISPPFPGLDSGLMANLPSTSSTTSYWGWGWLPDRCRDVANMEGFSPYDIQVFNVTYSDCGMPWVMCRHHSSEISQYQMVEMFGRLPVHMRQWVRLIIAFPGNPGRHAYTYSDYGDSVMFGDVQNYITIWVHEIAHTLDWNPVGGIPQFSTSSMWLNAYNMDTAVSDTYAATNQAENFAQEVNIALFDNVVPGGIATVQPNWIAVYNQYTTAQTYLGSILTPGGTCTRRTANADVVCMGEWAGCTASNAEAGPAAIDSAWVESNNPIEVVAPPKTSLSHTNCTFAGIPS